MRVVLFGAMAAAAIAVSACAETPTYYRKDGASPGEFERTKAMCSNEAYAIGGAYRPASVGQVMHNCMVASGWYLVAGPR